MSRIRTESELAEERRRDDVATHRSAAALGAARGRANVKLLNVSARGVLLETAMALPPGRSISLRFSPSTPSSWSAAWSDRVWGSLTSNSVSYYGRVPWRGKHLVHSSWTRSPRACGPDDMTLVVSVAQNADGVDLMMNADLIAVPLRRLG
jgi:hypothetical protein